eukprot:9483377-Pyramimonas_sp.AAC.1
MRTDDDRVILSVRVYPAVTCHCACATRIILTCLPFAFEGLFALPSFPSLQLSSNRPPVCSPPRTRRAIWGPLALRYAPPSPARPPPCNRTTRSKKWRPNRTLLCAGAHIRPQYYHGHTSINLPQSASISVTQTSHRRSSQHRSTLHKHHTATVSIAQRYTNITLPQ